MDLLRSQFVCVAPIMTFSQPAVFLFLLAICRTISAAAPASVPAATQSAHAHAGLFGRAVEQFGGRVVDPAQFPNDLRGFQLYLASSGVRAYDAADLTYPNRPEVAAEFGFTWFLPPQAWWSRGAALALLAQQIEDCAGETVKIRNWWRPPAYNQDPRVGGAPRGDHIAAFGMDLDYLSSQGRRRAEQWLRGLAARNRWLQLSLGLGDRTTHIGILSPRGSREWHYASYRR
jgi:hypothetical protein